MKKKLIKKKQPKLNSLFFFQYSPSVSLSPFCCLLIPPFCHFPPLGAIVHLMQSRTRLQAQAKFKPLLVTCLPLKYRQLAVKSQRIKPEDVMAETGFLIFIYLHIIACSCMFVNVSQLPHVLHPSWEAAAVTVEWAPCLSACDGAFPTSASQVQPSPSPIYSEMGDGGTFVAACLDWFCPLLAMVLQAAVLTGLCWKPRDGATALRSHCAIPVRLP